MGSTSVQLQSQEYKYDINLPAANGSSPVRYLVQPFATHTNAARKNKSQAASLLSWSCK
jgi:hypothetical protein